MPNCAWNKSLSLAVLMLAAASVSSAREYIHEALVPARLRIYGASAQDQFGSAATPAVGDLDNDGVPDLAVGAPSADGPDELSRSVGEVHVFFGPLLDGPTRDL